MSIFSTLFKLDCLGFFCYWLTWALFTFWILTSYQKYGLQIFFSHSISCLFILLFVLLLLCRCFYFDDVSLTFAFVACTFGVIYKNLLPRSMTGNFPKFPPGVLQFQVLHLFIFLCVFIYLKVQYRGSILFFCMWLSSFPSTIYWRDYPFLHWVFLVPLSSISWKYILEFISDLLVLFREPTAEWRMWVGHMVHCGCLFTS